ncbi:MAG: erythromycin esterase family protein [Alphaproteobacteria bacterium]|nr:erythromycin esterase family protein [Alphaproteobacteria bacterium]
MLPLILLALGCTEKDALDSAPPDTSPTDDSAEVSREVAPGIFTLDTLEWGAEVDDLAPLGAIIGDARVTALGESVHYSGGYHAARARIIPYLVEELGFRAVAFEGPWLTAESSRPYVERCEGALVDAMAGLYFSVWQSADQGRVMEWLCAWNSAHPDDVVHFWGFDIQEPWRDGPWLRGLLEGVDAEGTQALRDGVSDCFGAGYADLTALYADPEAAAVMDGTGAWPEERGARCEATLPQVDAWLETHATAVSAAHDAETVALAHIAVTAIGAAHGEMTQLYDPGPAGWDARDQGMFEVFQALRALRAPEDKVIIFAHNAHIVAAGEQIAPYVYPQGWVDMGSHLATALGDDYAPIGFVADEVVYNWPGQGTNTSRARQNSAEAALTEVGASPLLIDLAAASADGSFLAPDTAYGFGHPGTGTLVPAAHFRGLLFLDSSPEMAFWQQGLRGTGAASPNPPPPAP